MLRADLTTLLTTPLRNAPQWRRPGEKPRERFTVNRRCQCLCVISQPFLRRSERSVVPGGCWEALEVPNSARSNGCHLSATLHSLSVHMNSMDIIYICVPAEERSVVSVGVGEPASSSDSLHSSTSNSSHGRFQSRERRSVQTPSWRQLVPRYDLASHTRVATTTGTR